MSLGWKVLVETETEYKIEDQAPTNPVELGQHEGNDKALNANHEPIEKLCIYEIYATQDYQTNVG